MHSVDKILQGMKRIPGNERGMFLNGTYGVGESVAGVHPPPIKHRRVGPSRGDFNAELIHCQRWGNGGGETAANIL
jgi:hypothetical protein